MKLAIVTLAVLALAVAVFADDSTFSCDKKDTTGKTKYRDPNSSNKGWKGNYACMTYHDCKDNKDTIHHCFWLVPLLQFDNKTQKCVLFWNANCDA